MRVESFSAVSRAFYRKANAQETKANPCVRRAQNSSRHWLYVVWAHLRFSSTDGKPLRLRVPVCEGEGGKGKKLHFSVWSPFECADWFARFGLQKRERGHVYKAKSALALLRRMIDAPLEPTHKEMRSMKVSLPACDIMFTARDTRTHTQTAINHARLFACARVQ